MTKEEFEKLAEWKRMTLKKEKNLY